MRALILSLAAASLALAADAEPDAKLSGKLVITDLQGGFAGFTGKVYTVEPDGSYSVGNQARGKVTETGKGKLDAKALAKVAAAAKKYGADTLKDAGRAMANPHAVTITYGKNTAVLNLPTTAPLPAADEKEMPGRFAGVVNAVVAAIPKPKAKGGADK